MGFTAMATYAPMRNVSEFSVFTVWLVGLLKFKDAFNTISDMLRLWGNVLQRFDAVDWAAGRASGL